jgi:hypothetical protein
MGLIFAAAVIAIGLIFIVGGLRKWKFLVDPPKNSLFWWPQAFLRTLVPLRHMPWVTALIGLIYIAIGVMILSRWLSE